MFSRANIVASSCQFRQLEETMQFRQFRFFVSFVD